MSVHTRIYLQKLLKILVLFSLSVCMCNRDILSNLCDLSFQLTTIFKSSLDFSSCISFHI